MTTFAELQQTPLSDFLDFEVLERRLRGDEDALMELLAVFSEYAPIMFTAIEVAHKEQDEVALYESAHRFKGACLQLSAGGLAGLAASIESEPGGSHDAVVEGLRAGLADACYAIATLGSNASR